MKDMNSPDKIKFYADQLFRDSVNLSMIHDYLPHDQVKWVLNQYCNGKSLDTAVREACLGVRTN